MRRISIKRQTNEFNCGPAVIQAILATRGIALTQARIARKAKTGIQGTSTRNLATALNFWEVKVRGGNHQSLLKLKQALKAKKVVIVCYTYPNSDEGHWAIVQKIDKKTIALHDSLARGGKSSMPIEQFLKRWQDPKLTRSTRFAYYID